MRIALVCTEKLPVPPIRGGAIQTYIGAVAPLLAQQHTVTVVSRADEALPETETVPGTSTQGRLSYVRLQAPTPDAYYAGVAQYLAGVYPPFDRVHLYNRPAFVPLIARNAPLSRLSLSMHNDMMGPDRMGPEEGSAILRQVDAVVTISDHVRRTIDRFHPGFASRMRTVYAGVDTDRFRPGREMPGVRAIPAVRAEVRQRLGIEPDAPVVLHVSRLSPNKGNHLAVRAIAEVLRTHPQARLILLGSSRYGSQVRDAYGQSVWDEATATLGEAVRLIGFVPPDTVHEYFAAGDLFLCTSQWEEPLARVHYEAMGAGLAIVTTDRGGNCEVVEEGHSGLAARPHDDPTAFAGLINHLLERPDLREAMGRRGRELAESRYTWPRVAGELLEIFSARG